MRRRHESSIFFFFCKNWQALDCKHYGNDVQVCVMQFVIMGKVMNNVAKNTDLGNIFRIILKILEGKKVLKVKVKKSNGHIFSVLKINFFVPENIYS